MDRDDVLHMIIIDESYTGDPIDVSLQSGNPYGDNDEGSVPDAPVVYEATSITSAGFQANWALQQNITSFRLDVSISSTFATFVAGFNNKTLGNVNHDHVAGLADFTTYYYRIRGVNDNGTSVSSEVIDVTTSAGAVVDGDGNSYSYVTIGTQQWLTENLKTTKYINGSAIPNITSNTDFTDWFLPSRDELNTMYTELHLYGVGGFSDDEHMSSSEFNATEFYTFNFGSGSAIDAPKTDTTRIRPCRAFTSVSPSYSVRDVGLSGGLIFWKSGNDYLEAFPIDLNIGAPQQWSNIIALAIGTTGTAVGTGQANTTAIIAQVGHTTSAAKFCNDLSYGGWVNDTAGAYCWYDNDITYKTDYGALYNWYAVDHGVTVPGPAKLAPTGWRVPSDADWTTLITYLGGAVIAGGILKETGYIHWNVPNTSATDNYGFKSLGAGIRNFSGVYELLNQNTYYWTSDDSGGTDAYSIQIIYNYALTDSDDVDKNYGFSVRCMRDV